MSTHSSSKQGSLKVYIWVWLWLIVLTGVEIALAFQELSTTLMLFFLISLSMVKAGLIISYFMHLQHETRGLKWTLITPLILVIVFLFAFFPDSIRILDLRP